MPYPNGDTHFRERFQSLDQRFKDGYGTTPGSLLSAPVVPGVTGVEFLPSLKTPRILLYYGFGKRLRL